jgi:hypothetical protein
VDARGTILWSIVLLSGVGTYYAWYIAPLSCGEITTDKEKFVKVTDREKNR